MYLCSSNSIVTESVWWGYNLWPFPLQVICSSKTWASRLPTTTRPLSFSYVTISMETHLSRLPQHGCLDSSHRLWHDVSCLSSGYRLHPPQCWQYQSWRWRQNRKYLRYSGWLHHPLLRIPLSCTLSSTFDPNAHWQFLRRILLCASRSNSQQSLQGRWGLCGRGWTRPRRLWQSMFYIRPTVALYMLEHLSPTVGNAFFYMYMCIYTCMIVHSFEPFLSIHMYIHSYPLYCIITSNMDRLPLSYRRDFYYYTDKFWVNQLVLGSWCSLVPRLSTGVPWKAWERG